MIKTLNGVKVGFLAYCGEGGGECESNREGFKAGPALLHKTTVEKDIKLLKVTQWAKSTKKSLWRSLFLVRFRLRSLKPH